MAEYTGTSTWVALEGTTDANGNPTKLTRVISTDQPVNGWARKSSSSPYYKVGSISGTIDSTDGVELSAILASDE